MYCGTSCTRLVNRHHLLFRLLKKFLFAHSIFEFYIIFRYKRATFDGVSVFKIEENPDAFYLLIENFLITFSLIDWTSLHNHIGLSNNAIYLNLLIFLYGLSIFFICDEPARPDPTMTLFDGPFLNQFWRYLPNVVLWVCQKCHYKTPIIWRNIACSTLNKLRKY